MASAAKRKFIGNKYFTIVNGANGFGKCNVEGCDYNYTPTKGSPVHSKPLADHFKRKHSGLYKTCERLHSTEQSSSRSSNLDEYFLSNSDISDTDQSLQKSKTIKFEVSPARIQHLAIEAVTKNGLPFSVFEKSALQKMLHPVLSKVGVSLNRKPLRELTLKMAKERITKMKEMVKGHLLSLKVDLCTRKGRHFIGINIQTVLNGKLEVFTLCVKEMFVQSTSAEIKSMIINSLLAISVEVTQIYSVTTDNGANVLKSVDLLSKDSQAAEQETLVNIFVENSSSESDEFDEGDVDYQTAEDEANSMHTVEVIVDNAIQDVSHLSCLDQRYNFSIISMRCAAHTLQLAVNDVLKETNFRNVLEKARKVVKKTRTQNLRLVFQREKHTLPILDCETRWGTTFLMLQSLINGKEFLIYLALTNEALLLSDSDWSSIEEMAAALKPMHQLTKVLQYKSLTAGQLLGEWVKTRLVLSSSTGSTRNQLLRAMLARESAIMENPAFLAAVFLDLRYQKLLTEDQKSIAQRHVLSVWKKLQRMTSDESHEEVLPVVEVSSSSVSSSSSNDVEEEQRAENLLETLLKANDSIIRNENESIFDVISDFGKKNRLQKDVNILLWWSQNGPPELQDVALTILALPVTQVSVERTFSGLKYILDDLRMKLKNDIIDAVMILRCNT